MKPACAFPVIVCVALLGAFVVSESLGDDARPGGIIRVTRGKMDLKTPPNVPQGQLWQYGMGIPFQVDLQTAGLFCNIRGEGTPYGDFELGSDLILFDDLGRIDPKNAIPVSRYDEEFNPKSKKPCILAKYPMLGGFVPFGAKRADGSAHPHAGTGFALLEARSYPKDPKQSLPPASNRIEFREFHQFSYDGKTFRTTSRQRIQHWNIEGGWEVISGGLSMAIPDGDDLLFPMSAVKRSSAREPFDKMQLVCGLGRFRNNSQGWQLASFVSISDQKIHWVEPTLIRDTDGSLLFSARLGYGKGDPPGYRGDIPLWRSTDVGRTWKKRFHLKRFAAGAPVTLNQAGDGTAFFATNKREFDRQVLCIYPLNPERTGLEQEIVVRHGPDEFGKSKAGWKIDHPTSAVLRLADGQWHSVLVYRVLDQAENYGAAPTPFTGLYVEEIFTKGKPIPSWSF
jgi:hypothetical protein